MRDITRGDSGPGLDFGAVTGRLPAARRHKEISIMDPKLNDKPKSDDTNSIEGESEKVSLERYDFLFAVTFAFSTIAVLLMLYRRRIAWLIIPSLVIVIVLLAGTIRKSTQRKQR